MRQFVPPREWKLYIEDILNAIAKIQRYTAKLDKISFLQEELIIDAVIRNITIIGEAARQIPENIESTYQDIPFSKMRGFRNIVVHQYFGVSLDILWETIQRDLQPLVPLLNDVLQENS